MSRVPGSRQVVSSLRAAVHRRTIAAVLLGLVAGYSATLFDTAAVTLPVVGAVSGPLLGALGIGVSVAAFLRMGRCEECGGLGLGGGCGCSGDCDGTDA